jgi:GT2 family glycosyltransferase
VLSVVVVNYHQWRNTARLVGQLQAGRPEEAAREVVVVDNHSPRSRLRAGLRRRPGVSLRVFGGNRGFSRAVNEGARLSRGDWLLLLNPDVTAPPGLLDRVVAEVPRWEAERPRAGIIGLGLRNPDGTAQGSWGPLPTLARTLGGLLWPRASRKYRSAGRPERREVPWVTGCGLLVRRDCWQQLGGFSEDFFLYYEDVDLCRRARAAGWSVWHEPAWQVTHLRPLHSRSVPPALRVLTRHALLTYARRHWPAWQYRILSNVVCLESLVRAFLARMAGRPVDASLFGRLHGLARDLLAGRDEAAWTHVRHAARQLARRNG